MAKLYTVSDRRRHGPERRAPTWASPAATRPTAPSWPSTARPRPTGGSSTAAPTRATSPSWTWPRKTFKDLTDFAGMDSWPMWSQDGFDLLRLRPRRQAPRPTSGAFPRAAATPSSVTDFTRRRRPVPGDLRRRQDDRLRTRLRHRQARRRHQEGRRRCTFDIAAETQESLTEFREFHSTVDDYDLAPDGKRIAFAVHGEVFTAPTDEGGELRQITDGPARDQNVLYSPDGKWLAYVSDQSGREEIYVIAADGSGPAKPITDLDALKSSLRLVARLQVAGLHHLRRQALHHQPPRARTSRSWPRRSTAGSAGRRGRPTASGSPSPGPT